ncbi:MAG: GNAT family N-acetyltransferase [[Clostridium] fimetarium]|nr:GNAT family N-acetyltransferase [Alistipes timonensis]MCM1406126.1 GNAT family N-acetyltransferase [[Clostridium] fimetarium]
MIEPRKLTDIERLMEWRRKVLECVFGSAPDEALLAANRKFYERHIADGSHLAVIADFDSEEAGCGAVCYYDEMPSPDNRTGRCGYIMNIYVRPRFRGKGVATAILKYLIHQALDNNCEKIYLESTDMGRTVYSNLGFTDMENMMKYKTTDND